MRAAYVYNEILPTGKAHDGYVWRNCVSLAGAGVDMTLACGRGSGDVTALAAHYGTESPGRLAIERLAVLRRNFGLPITWNRVFDAAAQRFLERTRPQVALLSVRKQGRYHLARKLAGVRYVYEVHELAWYPTLGDAALHAAAIAAEREMLARADLITVTTRPLHDILRSAPYGLANDIAVMPLAITPPPLPPPISHSTPLHVMYVGQLYTGQGVEDLVAAVVRTPQVRLTIVGGQAHEIARLRAAVGDASARIHFMGFVAPAAIPALAASAHAFAAPFRAERRMPFVAHTKLLEYIALRRPVVAPDLPIVRDHFPGGAGLASHAPNDVEAIAAALRELLDRERWQHLVEGIAQLPLHDWPARARAYAERLR
jgi:glycosyltransferase involved in cell wall biosynthesis